jgi:hypothetical protein
MQKYVTDIKDRDAKDGGGVEIHLGTGIEKDKVDRLAAKCGPKGTGCDSDCCDVEFQSKIEDIDVSGVDDNVTMHLRGAVTAQQTANIMSRCNCYNDA